MVQTDLDAIYAGLPDWATFRSFRRGVAPVEGPPASRGGWQAWNTASGGQDYGSSVVALTIVAEGEATVVLRPPTVAVEGYEPVGSGVVLARYVAGASISPLGFDVDLDSLPEMAVLHTADGDRLDAPLAWALAKGEVQTVLLRVHCSTPGRWRWSARLPLWVDGRSVVEPITGPKGPFVLIGRDPSLPDHIWDGHRWRQEDAAPE